MKSTPTTVALKDLVLSPLNVRTNVEDATSVDQLAANIAANGLLQPIAIHALKKPKGKFGVVAGGRRYRALEKLYTEKVENIGREFFAAIPAVLLEGIDEELIEASLSENYVRVSMQDYEIYAAFKAINLEPGQLAAHFGIEPARARRILRLANLSDSVFDAYRHGVFDTKVAMAFAATENHALQDEALKAWQQLPSYQQDHQAVRRLLGFGNYEAKRLLEQIGEEAYEAAGGKLEKDLFSDEVKVLDPELLIRIRTEQQEAQLAALKASAGDEVTWTEAYPGGHAYSVEAYQRRIEAEEKPTKKQTKRMAEIDDKLEELGDWLSQSEVGDDSPEAEQEEFRTKSAEYDALERELHNIKMEVPKVMPAGPKLGVIALNYEGDYEATFYTLDEAKGDTVPELDDPKEKPELTSRASDWLQQTRKEMLRKGCLDTAAWQVYRFIFQQAIAYGSPPNTGLQHLRTYDSVGLTFRDADWFRERSFEKFCDSHDHDELDRLASELLAAQIDHHRPGENDTFVVREFGQLANTNARAYWTPTSDFFDLFKKTQLLGFAAEIGGLDDYVNSNMKLAEVKERMLAITTGEAKAPGVSDEARAAALAWVPKWLRFTSEDETRASVPPEPEGEGEVPDKVEDLGRINEELAEAGAE